MMSFETLKDAQRYSLKVLGRLTKYKSNLEEYCLAMYFIFYANSASLLYHLFFF